MSQMTRMPAVSATNLAGSASSAASRSRTIAYWVITVLVAGELGVGGVWDILLRG